MSVDVLIERHGDAYQLDGMPMDAAFVQALSRALAEPANPQLTLADLGITPEWLSANSSIYVRQEVVRAPAPTPEQEALFEKIFKDTAVVEAALPGVYKSWHTDDYASVQVAATFEDGATISASSRSQHAFMLPWSLVRDGKPETAYNADISRAVATLMPEKSPNQARIAGKGLAFEVAGALMSEATARLRTSDAESVAGEALKLLETRYVTMSPEIRNNDHPDEEWTAGGTTGPGETNLHVGLGMADWPKNFTDEVVLSYQDGAVQGVGDFMRRVKPLEAEVLSMKWLTGFLAEHPTVRVRMSFVHDGSLTDSALKAFSADMHAIGKDNLASQVEGARDRTALLLTGMALGQSSWLVLPDGRTILWRYSGFGSLLKWSKTDFTIKPCSGQQSPFGGCVGVEISSSGYF